MKKIINPIDIEINMDDLPKLIKVNPKLATLYGSLYGLDRLIKKMILDYIERFDDPEKYAIKTQLAHECYELILWHKDLKAMVGRSFPLADFIDMCRKGNDFIELKIGHTMSDILKRYDSSNTLDREKVNWV